METTEKEINEYNQTIIEIEQKLSEYLKQNYDMQCPDIQLKYVHTFNTKKVNEEIANTLSLSPRDVYLSNVIALFHDYARFEQYKLYKTYNDLASVDHADLAVEMLFDKKQIFNFVNNLTQEELDVVRIAIKNHNKLAIEPNLTERQTFFCKLIRDADKVDIYRILSGDPRCENVKEGKLTKQDLDIFYSHQIYKKTKDYNFYNSALLHICLIYDINFKKSFEILNREGYLKKYMYTLLLFANFKVDEELTKCFSYAEEYVKNKAK